MTTTTGQTPRARLRGKAISTPHILPDAQMERMTNRAAAVLRDALQLSTHKSYRLAYAMIEAAGFTAACVANERRATPPAEGSPNA